jgi:rSAM/selenodomain-associated transferase 1
MRWHEYSGIHTQKLCRRDTDISFQYFYRCNRSHYRASGFFFDLLLLNFDLALSLLEPMDTPLLIVFTRNPIKGKVKTRLAASSSDDYALDVYNKLRVIARKAAFATGADLAVYYDDHIPGNDIFFGEETQLYLQKGNDLGARMADAFEQGFSDNYRRIVLIGTDCPELGKTILLQAFELLKENSAVLGPAKDGGYYLIGLNRPCPGLFTGRTWSTERVLRETLDELDRNNLTYGLLPVLSDIDTVEDLENFKQDLW